MTLIDEAFLSGSRIVADGRLQEVMDGLNLLPKKDVFAYWDHNRNRGFKDGTCHECGKCEMYVDGRGTKCCPHTGAPCVMTCVFIFGRKRRDVDNSERG